VEISEIVVSLLLSAGFAAGCLAVVAMLWRRGKPWKAATVLFVGAVWMLYSRSLLDWLLHLGSDSFSEAQDFDITEAAVFLETLGQVFEPESFLIVALTACAGIGVAGSVHLLGRRLFQERWRLTAAPMLLTASAATIAFVALQVYPAFASFRWNSQYYQSIHDNFHAHEGRAANPGVEPAPLNVIVHIGESMTSMNMGLYGYVRDTTPKLGAFAASRDSLLVFRNVFSPHTHTAPSLLEALSIGVDASEDFIPISDRQRISIVDLLEGAGIQTALISNQGRSGAWNNLASTVVFKNVSAREFSLATSWLGELDHYAARPYDHEFLTGTLDRAEYLEQPGPRLVFLHSYAGHSPYHRNIPPDLRHPVDGFFDGLSDAVIVGNVGQPSRIVRRVQQYDSVVRYNDAVIAELLHKVEASPHPGVYVYFSDHGEAVYTGRGHDSSRFVHEMARVPFLIYFNDAALELRRDTFLQLRAASRAGHTSTLSQVPATLMFLFGITDGQATYTPLGLEHPRELPPILTRQTADGFSFLPLGNRTLPGDAQFVAHARDDPPTTIFLASRSTASDGPGLCYGGVNTIAQALRGAIVAQCLHVRLSAAAEAASGPSLSGEDGAALVGKLLELGRSYGHPVWLEIEDPRPAGQCTALLSLVAGAPHRGVMEGSLLMLPAEGAGALDEDLDACLDGLRAAGFRIGLRLPSDAVDACSAALTDGGSVAPCALLQRLVADAERSGLFTDLGVTLAANELIGRPGVETHLAWNASPADPGDIDLRRLAGFRLVAVEWPEDPNHRHNAVP